MAPNEHDGLAKAGAVLFHQCVAYGIDYTQGGISMAKWADYCISAVRYNQEKTHIVKVIAHEDSGGSLGAGNEMARISVVAKIEGGKSFVTIYKNSDGKWTKGKEVQIIKVDGEKFIRTDANHKKCDNLENLPEF